MKIKYVLHKNAISPNPNDYKAVVVDTLMHSIKDIVKLMTEQGSILKETECMAVSEALLKSIGTNLANGIGFYSDYFTIRFEIQGTFESEDDKYDPERHTLYANLIPGKLWKKSTAKALLEKILPKENKPQITQMVDIKSKTSNTVLTPGGMVELKGQLLKIDESADDEGVFLADENGTEIKIDYLYQNYPKSLLFEVPENLSSGNYQLIVKNRAHKGNLPRAGTLEHLLKINQ